MSRKALLVAVLAVSTGLFAQRSGGGTGSTGSGSSGTGTTGSGTTAGSGINTSASQAGSPTTQGAVGGLSGQAAAGPINNPGANTAGTPTLPSAMAGPSGTTGTTQANPDNLNNGSTFNNGFVGTGVAGSGVLSTPGGTFASPAPTAGISDAGRAGISANTPLNTGVQSTLETSTVVYTNGAPVNPSGMNVSSAANSPGRAINDLGPSFFSNTIAGSGSTASLGEVAAQYKASKGAANARMLTNDDVQKMVADKSGVTMARNMPPLGPGAVPQSTTAQSSSTQPTSTQAQSTQTAQAGASASQQGQPSAAQQPGTPPPATTQGQATGSESAAGNPTTPQINQNQQSNDAQGRSKLPATSTFLPLLGLLGAVSGGFGLWFRKFRR
jgi:hypothetical protein